MEVDSEGVVLYANPASQRLFPDLALTRLAHPWLVEWDKVMQFFRQRGEQSYQRDVKVGDRNYQQALYYLPAESVVRIYGLDITKRKRAEEALQKAQARLLAHAEELEEIVTRRTAKLHESISELEHFSYAITHDMRAPLRAMQGFAELIEEECAACGRTMSKEYFRRIKIASKRLDRLIADSLNYSQAARQELTLEPVDVQGLLNGLLETYPNLQPDQAGIHIEADLPVVMGNEAALTQCFSNLLSNAVKFAKPGVKPQIRIRAEPVPNNFVRFWVEDNGIGITPSCQARIFELFQRGSSDYEGTGLGLAIVRKVVHRMGGEVGVESEPGQGSRFWVQLPKASDA